MEPIVEQQVDIQVELENLENQIQNDQEDLLVEPQQPVELRRSGRLVYSSGSLETIGYTDSDFQGDIDSRKSTSR